MGDEFYTCVAKCRTCDAELDRAEHVPAEHRDEVMKWSPVAARCEVAEHNTAEDHNLNFVLQWYRETAKGLELLLVVAPDRPS